MRSQSNSPKHPMSDAVRAAIVVGLLGIIGTVIGAVITGGFGYLDNNHSSPTPTATAELPAITTSAGAPTATTPSSLKTVLMQPTPVCNNPNGTSWHNANTSAVSYSCPGNGLLMQQISSTVYAEFDLMQVNGTTYSQTNFRTQVQATFQNPNDCNTWAAMTFQSPPASAGGYIFGVAACGQWRLQEVDSATNIPIKGNGRTSAAQTVTITILVQDGVFIGSINGQQVISYHVGNPPGEAEVGLLVELDNAAPSSEVLYSNFVLAI